MRIGSDSGARNAAQRAPVVFVAFDLLWVEGRPVTDQPWELRRRQLDDLRLDGPGWRTSPIVPIDEAMVTSGGVVAKRRESTYRVGAESEDWIAARP